MRPSLASVAFTIPEGFPDTTRIWIYQADRAFTEEEAALVRSHLVAFANKWAAHNVKLKATGVLYFNRFICLFADESAVGASGCSIDSSVHFIQALEKEFQLSLTNRMQMAYLDGEDVKSLPLQALPEALKSGLIDKDTLVFNNLVAHLADMKMGWIIPLADSWHMRFAAP